MQATRYVPPIKPSSLYYFSQLDRTQKLRARLHQISGCAATKKQIPTFRTMNEQQGTQMVFKNHANFIMEDEERQ